MSVLDFLYTKVYETSNPRTKFQYMRSLKNKQVDYIFIGSSRVESGIVPSIIYQKTGKSSINLGFQAARLSDIYTILQLISDYNIQHQKIFVQLDYIYNMKGNSIAFQTQLVPFIRENMILKRYNDQYSDNSFLNYYFPFYRYCNNDLKIGFREIVTNLVHKKTIGIENKGYVGLNGNSKNLKGSLPNKVLKNSSTFDSIQLFIRRKNLNAVFYCAPFCKNIQNQMYLTELKLKIPCFLDFSKAIQNDKMFVNCNHLNDAGAKKFTEIFIERVLIPNVK